jgi:hypothetical protein
MSAEVLTSSYAVSPHALEVRAVQYGPDNTPIWGDRLALYAPEAPDVAQLDPSAWSIFDLLKEQGKSPSTISEQLGLDPNSVNTILNSLQERFLIYQEGTTTTIPFQPDLNSRGELYLETTEACNFSCGGCATGTDRYEAGQARTMTTETLNYVLTKTIESASQQGMKEFRIKWAGGEALLPLSFKLVKQAQDTIAQLQQAFPNVKLSQVILTNGTQFRPEVIEKLKQWDMRVSISLWGLGEQNNLLRGARRTQDKFENIKSGLKALHDNGIPFSLNHVITPQNAEKFGNFLTAFWDSESDIFIGKDWKWGPEGPQPFRVGLAFYRPQTPLAIDMMQKAGYKLMVHGIRSGFAVIADLIHRGIPIQSLNRIDYLQLFGMIPAPCGSGFNYLAAGPRGWASCHEKLFAMPDNLEQVRRDDVDVLKLANAEYDGHREQLLGPNIEFRNLDERTSTILALHGGSACPHQSTYENEGKLGYAASTAELLYAPLIEEIISLETMRRLRRVD